MGNAITYSRAFQGILIEFGATLGTAEYFSRVFRMASIIKRKNKAGEIVGWQVKIRRDGYPPQSKTFKSKREADDWALDQERDMSHGSWRDRSSADSTTFYKLLERYNKDVTPTKRGADTEKVRIGTLQRDDLAKYKLSALSPMVLADWRDRRLAAGCAGSTVNRELNVISAVFNYARKELMIAVENPVAGIRRPPTEQGRERRLEDDEETRLLAALEEHSGEQKRADGKKYRVGTKNRFIKPVVRFAIETAMRRGEILALAWENVDLQKRTAYLPRTKNGDSRTVPLSSRAIAVLEELKTERDGVKPLCVGRVFPVTENALKLSFRRAAVRAGITNLHFHDLRHEATSRLAELLPNLIELAAVTGHKDLRMLKRYYHPRAEDLARKLG